MPNFIGLYSTILFHIVGVWDNLKRGMSSSFFVIFDVINAGFTQCGGGGPRASTVLLHRPSPLTNKKKVSLAGGGP